MKRLPVYILIDTSGSMRGEPIEAVKTGLKAIFSSLKRDSLAVETVYICIITFDRAAKILVPLTKLERLNFSDIPPLESSPTNLGEALELMCNCYKKEVRVSDDENGDWLPIAVVMTDGSPSDTELFNQMCKLLSTSTFPFAKIIGCAAGPKAKTEPLERFCTEVVTLETMDSSSFLKFWQWVSNSFVSPDQKNNEGQIIDIPPPPKEIPILF
jgi:uncharacterized protein YegL